MLADVLPTDIVLRLAQGHHLRFVLRPARDSHHLRFVLRLARDSRRLRSRTSLGRTKEHLLGNILQK